MKFPPWLKVYGNQKFRGECPSESYEQMSIVNKIRKAYPDSFGLIVLHPRNEGLKERGQFSAVSKHAAEGMAKGASDIIIPGNPTFVCELKRKDHTQSKFQEGQLEFLEAAYLSGAFCCVALGAESALSAFNDWKNQFYGN